MADMMTGEMPTGEREPARWEELVGGERDATDIGILEEEYGGETANAASRKFAAGSGLIQRQGGRPVGYMLFDVVEGTYGDKKGPSLLIKHFYTNKAVRGIGTFRRIIEVFREQAERRECEYVMWTPVTLMEVHLSKRMGMKKEGNRYIIPVKELDVHSFIDRL
jgi:GNAT superfamily N-acetyltransferase